VAADDRLGGETPTPGGRNVKANAEDWRQYYAVAARRRREAGGDPFTNYARRKASQQRALFIGSSLFLVGLVAVLYTVLAS
jgi:hypothetical protein